tara:strand:- start:5260 stop:5616 length:357 start_codon:yes stop_codon:yes gene_type:complete
MPNPWIEHIKKFAKANNTTFGCALSNPKCKETYKKPSQTQTKQPTFKQPTFKEIAENRKKADKQAKAGSAVSRREVRSWFTSRTISDPNYPPVDLNKDKADFTIGPGLKKKKSGLIFD